MPEHEFDLGLKLEAVDQTNPKVITVATVTQVVGRTVWVQLDGYQDDSVEHIYDVESHNLFPCGWCSMNGHPLLTPKHKTGMYLTFHCYVSLSNYKIINSISNSMNTTIRKYSSLGFIGQFRI